MDQTKTPVLDAIEQAREAGIYSFSLPGHRYGQGIDDRTAEVLSRDTFASDVLMAKSAVSDAEALYADAVGAKQAVFTTCGSSISIHTAALTIAGPGRKVLVDRNVHKSVVASLVLGGIEPVWLRPNWDHERQIAHPARLEAAEESLQADPDISAMIVITPTEYGTGADVAGFADLCHRHGIPLLVDEAWGGHFGFHPDPPTAAIQAGADLAVQSLHKADGGLCQSSMILVGGDLVDPVDLRLRLDLMTTTSPSPLMYGSIDGWRRRLALDGKDLIDGALARADRIRRRLQEVPAYEVLDSSIHDSEGVAEWDPLKLCIDVSALGITGVQAKEWLLSQHQLQIQLGDTRRIVCSLSYGDDDAAIERLTLALLDLAEKPPKPDRPTPAIPRLEDLDLEQAMPPRDAYFAPTEQVSDPVGRICAEMISPYPPGVPVVLPGERFNSQVVDYLRAGLEAKMTLPDDSDPELKTFRVVRQN